MNTNTLDVMVCKICEVSKQKYICPKCGIPYCSLKCYQNLEKHIKCSESFYQECVEEEVKQEQDPSKAKKMQEILNRFHQQYDAEKFGEEDEQSSLDSDDDEPLAKRMENVNLDDSDQVWNSMTFEEKEDFKSFVQKNLQEKTIIIPEWLPWWTKTIKKIVIEEIPENSELMAINSTPDCSYHKTKLHDEQPDILDFIPTMETLTKIPPSTSVKLGLVNVIGCYIWTARLYGGDFVEVNDQFEVAYVLISLSSFLNVDQVFCSFQESVTDVASNACKNPDLLNGGPTLQRSLQQDVYLILTGGVRDPIFPILSTRELSKSYVLSALTQCYRLLTTVVEKLRKDKAKEKLKMSLTSTSLNPSPTTSSDSESFKKIFLSKNSIYTQDSKMYTKALRKIHYLLAFANEFEIL